MNGVSWFATTQNATSVSAVAVKAGGRAIDILRVEYGISLFGENSMKSWDGSMPEEVVAACWLTRTCKENLKFRKDGKLEFERRHWAVGLRILSTLYLWNRELDGFERPRQASLNLTRGHRVKAP